MSQLVLSQPFSGRFSFVVHVRLMVFLAVITLLIFALSPTLVSQAPAAMPSDLIFVPNMGQADASVQFQAHQGGNRWLFTQDEIIYSWVMAEENDEGVTDIPSPIPQFSTGTLRQQFLGTNKDAQFAAADPLASKLNYILGSDSSRWQTDLLTYATISAPNFYPGIDVVYQGQAGALELMLVIQPGANIEQIRWQYEGVTATELTKEGKLQLTIAGVEVKPVLDAPLAWQFSNNQQIPIDIHYLPQPDGSITLNVSPFDPALPLNISSVTSLANYAQDWVQDIYVDATGHVYVTGITFSTDFPIANPLQSTLAASSDVFITKFSSDGTELLYSTFLGGTDGEMGTSISVDGGGYIYLLGATVSQDFPLWNPLQINSRGDIEIFIAKLLPDGNAPVYSTYLGGTNYDMPGRVTNDIAGNAYITGYTRSSNFPVVNPLQATNAGREDVFISKISANGQSLLFSTYLGGNQDDRANSLAIDSQGNVFLTGKTHSMDFPLKNPIQATYQSLGDAFVSQLSSSGQSLVYSTFIGGSDTDEATDMAMHEDGSVSLIGQTYSPDFPLLNPLQATLNGSADFFVTHVSRSGTGLLYSTYLGGESARDVGMDIAVDGAGNYYVTGTTESINFPLVNPIQATYAGYQDGVVAVIDNTGTYLLFSTYVGGESSEFVSSIGVDPNNNVYVAGGTWSGAYPTTPGAWQENYAGGGDGFVTKILADGSAFGYSTYLGGGFPTDVTVSGMSGTTYDSWLVGSMIGGVGLLVMGYWVWRYRQGRKGIV